MTFNQLKNVADQDTYVHLHWTIACFKCGWRMLLNNVTKVTECIWLLTVAEYLYACTNFDGYNYYSYDPGRRFTQPSPCFTQRPCTELGKKCVLGCVISPLRQQAESRNLGHTFSDIYVV